MRYRTVRYPHWVCLDQLGDHRALSPSARGFTRRYSLPLAKAAETAWDGGELVGFFRYDPDRVLWALGTWVHPAYRRGGLALYLWSRALRRHRGQNVSVSTVSPGGRALVRALCRRYPELTFLRD